MGGYTSKCEKSQNHCTLMYITVQLHRLISLVFWALLLWFLLGCSFLGFKRMFTISNIVSWTVKYFFKNNICFILYHELGQQKLGDIILYFPNSLLFGKTPQSCNKELNNIWFRKYYLFQWVLPCYCKLPWRIHLDVLSLKEVIVHFTMLYCCKNKVLKLWFFSCYESQSVY